MRGASFCFVWMGKMEKIGRALCKKKQKNCNVILNMRIGHKMNWAISRFLHKSAHLAYFDIAKGWPA